MCMFAQLPPHGQVMPTFRRFPVRCMDSVAWPCRFGAVVKRRVGDYVLVRYDELVDEAVTDEKLQEWFPCTAGAQAPARKVAGRHLVNIGEGYRLRPCPTAGVSPAVAVCWYGHAHSFCSGATSLLCLLRCIRSAGEIRLRPIGVYVIVILLCWSDKVEVQH